MFTLFRLVLRPTLLAVPLALLAPLAAAQTKVSLPLPADIQSQLAVMDWSLQDITLPEQTGAPFQMALTLGSLPIRAELQPVNLYAPGFKLMVQGADGVLREEVPAQSTTYQGHVLGLPASVVAGSLVNGQFEGVIRLGPGETIWGVQPATNVDPQAARSLHVVHDSRSLHLPGVTCGTVGEAPAHEHGAKAAPEAPGDKICQIACDADFEFYNLNSSNVGATQTDITNVINGVQAIYQADVGILYEITQIIVRTAEPDPYTTTTPSTLLNQFQSYWNGNHAGVVRDVAHLFTGKNLSGSTIGIAQLSVICNLFSAYGLSQSKYTNNFTFRIALTAHELGHNWAASHCDGQPGCSIMCSGLGGCSGNVTHFSASSVTQITNKKNAVGCLSDPIPPSPPVLNNVTPSSAQALAGTTMTVNGSFLSQTTQVTAGGQPTSFTVVTDNQLTFLAPNATALGTTNVQVTTPGGVSNQVSYTTVQTIPPKLQGAVLAFSFFPYVWSFGGGSNDFATLVVGLNNVTFAYQAEQVLLFDFIVQQAPLNAVGLGSASIPIPVAALGITFYSQLITIDAGVADASNIVSAFVGG